MRSKLGFLAVTLLVVGLSGPVNAETTLQLLGRISAYADYCGLIAKRQQLDARFSSSQEYTASKRENDLSMYDSVNGLNCMAIEDAMDKVLASNRQASPSLKEDPLVHCRFPNHLRTVKTRRSNCDDQKGTVFAAPTEFPTAPKPTVKTETDGMEARLGKLKRLFDKGLISKDDYDAKRRKILDSL